MGTLYVAEQISTGAQRALKLINHDLLLDEKVRTRFAQEARIGGLIESDHVVQVIQAGVDEATTLPFLAMELLKGEDLARHLAENGAMPLDQVALISEQLCHALSAAHAVGVVHRDLKPENIFLATSRRAGLPFMVKVLDYGVAKIIAEARATTTGAIGTPLFMAPEQAMTGDDIGPHTDVWALGLIVFRMLTGLYFWRMATQGKSLVDLMREVTMSPLMRAS
ncbi:MAG: serine/threonine-protein kinase, partial [Polyangiales bacterium]